MARPDSTMRIPYAPYAYHSSIPSFNIPLLPPTAGKILIQARFLSGTLPYILHDCSWPRPAIFLLTTYCILNSYCLTLVTICRLSGGETDRF
jgi:hypothetical protein